MPTSCLSHVSLTIHPNVTDVAFVSKHFQRTVENPSPHLQHTYFTLKCINEATLDF